MFFAVAASHIGCKEIDSRNNTVDITLKNASTHDLAWVELVWKGPSVPGGLMAPGVSTTSVSVNWPNIPKAKINFIDRQTRKPYSIEVSFVSVHDLVASRKCRHVMIQILDYEKTEVKCE